MTANIPMCWKCASSITEKSDDYGMSSSLVGCKEENKIKDYSDAKKHCPLINRKLKNSIKLGEEYVAKEKNHLEKVKKFLH